MESVHEAARRNDVEALRRLLDEEPELLHAGDERNPPWGEPMHAACRTGSLEAVRLLLDRGANISSSAGVTPTNQADPPLVVACAAGMAEVVSLLLARGADPAFRMPERLTALMAASVMEAEHPGADYIAVIRMLLKDGRALVNARDRFGRTALSWACAWNNHMDRAHVLLLEGNADHTIADDFGLTPMDLAPTKAFARLTKWYEDELQKPALLTKARAVVSDTESISKAPEKAGARTEAEAQRAREAAARAYLKHRVENGEAVLELVGQARRRKLGGSAEEEERRAVLEHVVWWLADDLFVELMLGLRYIQ